jgi:hypothetical protein
MAPDAEVDYWRCRALFYERRLPALEPWFRDELAFAVARVGLLTTLRRVTNQRGAVA